MEVRDQQIVELLERRPCTIQDIALGLGIAAVTGLTGLPRTVVIFDAAMPAAMMCTLLARRYDNDAPLVASTVLVSTVIGVLTIPILLALL